MGVVKPKLGILEQKLFKVPGKVFLLGEYFILNFGSALLFSTQPCFEFRICKGKGKIKGIHPKSPAGSWILKHKEDFSKSDFQFIDPYRKNKGFGASSSQFLFVYFWTQFMSRKKKYLKNHSMSGERGNQFFKTWDLWNSYQRTIEDKMDQNSEWNIEKTGKKKLKASGADVMAQWSGGIVEVSLSPFFLRKHFWPFQNKELILASTGNKLKTYEHLQSLTRSDFSSLKRPTQMALSGFKEKSWEKFIGGVNLFYKELLALSLVSQKTKDYIKEISKWDGVQALKGSGAMGEDHILVFCKKSKTKFLEEKLKSIGLKPVAALKDLSDHGFIDQKIESLDFNVFQSKQNPMV